MSEQSVASAKPKLSVKTLLSPISGQSMALHQHPDLLVAKGLCGKGVSITPLSSRVVAPCRAKVLAIAATGHRVSLGAANGLIIDIIVGKDAIRTHGVGFTKQVKPGDIVEAGTVLLTLDLLKLQSLLDEIKVALVITKGALKLTPYHGNVRAGEDEVMQLIVKSG